MDTRRTLALSLFLTAAVAFTGHAHAGPAPAPSCGTRFRTARVELAAAGQEADRLQDARLLEKVATKLHFRTLAAVARDLESGAAAAEAAATRTAVMTLIGSAPAQWPASGGPAPACT
jgi:hypothetical protein